MNVFTGLAVGDVAQVMTEAEFIKARVFRWTILDLIEVQWPTVSGWPQSVTVFSKKTLEKCDTLGKFTQRVLFFGPPIKQNEKKCDTLGSWTALIKLFVATRADINTKYL